MPLKPVNSPPPVITLDDAGIRSLARELAERATDPRRRAILAIAGIPGSGKSTLAQAVVDQLNQAQPGSAMVYPMDGFHLPNKTLEQLGLRNRKGSPPTFDAHGYIKLLTHLRDASRAVSVPVFNRNSDEPVYTGKPEHAAGPRTRFIVTEGNYLLLQSMPWNAIGQLVDMTVLIDTPTQVAHRWIIERHMRFGRSPEAAEHWYQTNDKLNTEHILQNSLHADRIARWPARGV